MALQQLAHTNLAATSLPASAAAAGLVGAASVPGCQPPGCTLQALQPSPRVALRRVRPAAAVCEQQRRPPQAPGSWSRAAACCFSISTAVSQPLRACLQGAPSLQAPAHHLSPAVLGAPWPGGGSSLLNGMPMQYLDRWPAPCDISGGQNRSLTIHLASSCQPPKPAPRPPQLPQFACLAARHSPSCRPHSLPSPW